MSIAVKEWDPPPTSRLYLTLLKRTRTFSGVRKINVGRRQTVKYRREFVFSRWIIRRRCNKIRNLSSRTTRATLILILLIPYRMTVLMRRRRRWCPDWRLLRIVEATKSSTNPFSVCHLLRARHKIKRQRKKLERSFLFL